MSDQIVSAGTSSRCPKVFSRRNILISSAITGLSAALGFSILKPRSVNATMQSTSDAGIPNMALYYEHQAIWVYSFAAGALSNTNVGRAVKALALRNQADHMAHRDTLAAVVVQLGATLVEPEDEYNLSSYIQRGDGNIDSDVNIAKLALALETDAAIAYTSEISRLKTPALITAEASIGADEAAHATAIRAAFVSLGLDVDYVPAAFIDRDTREACVLRV